jgi:PilZ domain
VTLQTERSERRASSRHRIALPVTLDDTRGWTRDVSASGVFFTLRDRSIRPPEPREHIRFRLTFEHVDPRGPLHVECEGHVVRVEAGPEAILVAVTISSYDFGASEVPWTLA